MFFNRATVTLMSAGIGAFAAAASSRSSGRSQTGGFGGKVGVGKLDDIMVEHHAPAAASSTCPRPAPGSRPTRPTRSRRPRRSTPTLILAGMEPGIVALYQKCPHLGCRVPQCVSSQWFECPCHGSQYNRVGEKKAGPAPRGMDRFPVTVAGNGDVTVDTGVVVTGPPIGTNTTGQEAEGPHCIRAVGALMLGTCDDVDRVGPPRDHGRRAGSSTPLLNAGAVAPRARLGDRARRQPQAVLRRRGARGPAARARAALRRAPARRHRHRPPAVLDPRAGAAWPAPPRARRSGSSTGVRELFAPTGATAASTAPAATAA